MVNEPSLIVYQNSTPVKEEQDEEPRMSFLNAEWTTQTRSFSTPVKQQNVARFGGTTAQGSPLISTPIRTPKPIKPSTLKKRRNSPSFLGAALQRASSPSSFMPKSTDLATTASLSKLKSKTDEKIYELQMEVVRLKERLVATQAELDREQRVNRAFQKEKGSLKDTLDVLQARVDEYELDINEQGIKHDLEISRLKSRIAQVLRENDGLKESRPASRIPRPRSLFIETDDHSTRIREEISILSRSLTLNQPHRDCSTPASAQVLDLQTRLQKAQLEIDQLLQEKITLASERGDLLLLEKSHQEIQFPVNEAEDTPVPYTPSLLQQLEAPPSVDAACWANIRVETREIESQTILSLENSGLVTECDADYPVTSIFSKVLKTGTWLRKLNRFGKSPQLRYVWMYENSLMFFWSKQDPRDHSKAMAVQCKSIIITGRDEPLSWNTFESISRENGALCLTSRARTLVLLPSCWETANAWKESIDSRLSQ